MKKLVMFFVATFFLVLFTVPVQAQTWVGNMEGSGGTETGTILKQFQSYHGGCGECAGKGFMTMSSGQYGMANVSLYGKEKKVDAVSGYGEFGYKTGYSQNAATPGGFQESWGSQYGEIGGSIKSGR